MEPLYKSQLSEDHPLGPSTTAAGLSLSTADRLQATFRGTTGMLPLKSTSADLRNQQAPTGTPYGEATSASLWDSQLLKSCIDSPLAHSTKMQPIRNKMWSTGEFSRTLPGPYSARDRRGFLTTNISNFTGATPSVSTAATVSNFSHSSAADFPERDSLSRRVASNLSGNIIENSQPRSSQLHVHSIGHNHRGVTLTRAEASTGSSVKSRLIACGPASAGKCPAAVLPVATGEPVSKILDRGSRLRGKSSSGLKLSSMSATTGTHTRCLSPLVPAPISSSLSHLRTRLSSSQQPLGPHVAGNCLTDDGVSLTRPMGRDWYAFHTGSPFVDSTVGGSACDNSTDHGCGSDCRGGSSAEVPLYATHQAAPPLVARSTFGLGTTEGLPAHSFRRTGRRDIHSSAGERAAQSNRAISGTTAHASREPAQQKVSRSTESYSGLGVCRSTPGPKTERVKAFVGFLKELYLDQHLIPASSVVDCLATLASYAQGLPAPQGPSPPWCCVAGQEIEPAAPDAVCLKDRVVVQLLNVLMRAQVLGRAQASPAPHLGSTDFPAANELCSGLGRDPLCLVLSYCASDTLRVSLRPSSECGEPAASGAHSLLPLGSCSSVALAVSAIETISRHHVPMGASAPLNPSSKVHLCYSSLLRWLWEELCARRQHSVPFDTCTSLIACEACSSSICSEAECALMLPSPVVLPEWLDACNVDLAVLLLLSLASRPTRHPLTSQLLEQTSVSLDKCSAVGLAAWLRASAVMGFSSLENPAFFGRVLAAVAAQLPEMPLGTVLADVLWGLTLCGIPSWGFFRQAAPGIARNIHMFELEDLCLIGCCYALQNRGFPGVTGDGRRWSYRGYFLPAEFFRRLTGLKAYCLLGSVKMADTGPTPVLGGATYSPEVAKKAHEEGFTQGNAVYQEHSDMIGAWTPEKLVRTIVDKCQGLREFVSLKACRLLDFTQRIMENPSAVGAPALHGESDAGSSRSAHDSTADGRRLDHAEQFQGTSGRCHATAPTGPGSPGGAGPAYDPGIRESCLQPRHITPGTRAGQAFHSPKGAEPLQGPSRCETNCQASLDGLSGEEEVVSPRRPGNMEFGGPCGMASSMKVMGPMWGDQYVPAPAMVSALHNYGAEVHTRGFPGHRQICQIISFFRQALPFLGSCGSFATHAFFGYFFIVVVIYAVSFLS